MRFFVLLALLAPLSLQAQYKIKVKVKNLANTPVKLGYYFEDKQYIESESQFDKKGIAVFEGDESLPRGLYMIIFPERAFLDILISDDQEFSIETDTLDLIADLKISGSDENTWFFDYQKQMVALNKERQNIQEQHDKLDSLDHAAQASALKAQLDSLSKVASNVWKEVSEEHPNTLLASLLRAMNDEPYPAYSDQNFFEHINFAEAGLLRSPVIHRSMRLILARNLNKNRPHPIIINEVDRLINKAKANDQVYQYVCGYFLNFFYNFQREGMNRVFIHLADSYFLNGQSNWMDSTALAEIQERRDLYKGSTEGEIAPNIRMTNLDGDTVSLHDVDAHYTLLFFWSTGCGHCERATDSLSTFYARNKERSIEVVGVYTKTEHKACREFLETHQATQWINLIDPNNDSGYKQKYYVVGTPLMLLLNKEKRIISRVAGDDPIVRVIRELEIQREKY